VAMTRKYAPLEMYLKSAELESIAMTFTDIESIIKDDLPPSARKHRPWWSNNTTNRAITQSWVAAGFKVTQVNMKNESLVFVKMKHAGKTMKFSRTSASIKLDAHPAFGCLQGTVTMPREFDLTAPAMVDWAEITMHARPLDE